MSLEVDGRPHGVPIAVPRHDEADKFFHDKMLPGLPPPPLPPVKHNLGLRRIVLYMMTALIMMTTLAATSAGLAGSYAKERTKAVQECSKAMR